MFLVSYPLKDKLMAKRAVLDYLIKLNEPKHTKAVFDVGEHKGHAFRAVTDDPSFKAHGTFCEECGTFHINPYEGSPCYIRKDRPLEIAKRWAVTHDVVSYVECHPACYYKEPGKKTVFLGTTVKWVKLLPGEWERYISLCEASALID